MTQNHERAVTVMSPPEALALPDRAYLKGELEAIRQFQTLVHQLLIKDQDYGVIPGTTKPTLLKPGAEKMVKLLGLADTYEILASVEDWDKPLFRYIVRCKLQSVRTGGTVVAEGMGECNSYETKYRWRWVFESDLPTGVDKNTLVRKERVSKNNGRRYITYQLPNDEIYSQVNTILKMACKRALVAAALSAGRLSEIFTQDMEDITPEQDEPNAYEAPRPQTPQQQRPAAAAVGRMQQGQVIEGDFTPAPEEPRPQVQKAATPLEGWLAFLDTLTDQQRQTWVDAQLQHMGGLSFAECGENEQRNFLEWVRQTVRAAQSAKA